MWRWSFRRIRNVLSLLIVITSLGCLFLFHGLLTVPHVESHLWVEPQFVPRSTWPPLMAFVEVSSSAWLTSRPLVTRQELQESSLQQYHYPQVRTYQDIPHHWPVDHPLELDHRFGPTVGGLYSLFPLRFEYAPHCPVDADPFLPWIHDVIVASKQIHFVAQNKRRCRTAPSFQFTDLKNLEPQVALFQSVPVKRLTSAEKRQFLSSSNNDTTTTTTIRYRLASLEEADPDGKETRFICQFHRYGPGGVKYVLGESLSIFPYNYEHDNFLKKQHPLLTRPKDNQDIHGAHVEQIWNSILLFSCPIPSKVRGPVSLDLVPIRTPPRENMEGYCPQVVSNFDPKLEWSSRHVLPTVENSGRWANIPITLVKEEEKKKMMNAKPHYLVGCTWASAVFQTRGQGAAWDFTTSLRLLEWLIYHLYIAKFDHIYIYDNTEAFTNETSLERITNLFPDDKVTRIPWKFRVCNNNPPAHRNAGERSSQYAAEASCRIRYGPITEWMTFLDTDEYLIPQANWTDLPTWLQSSVASGAIDPRTNILSFFQTRAIPNIQFMEPYIDNIDNNNNNNKSGHNPCKAESKCLAKSTSITFLQTYDCERTRLPKPDYGFRAKKQIFRPSFVLNHFVHYTTVTRRIKEAPKEPSPAFVQRWPYERRVDEVKEAFMLHTKTTTPVATAHWQEHCRTTEDLSKCPVGIAWPLHHQHGASNVTQDGFAYNCYPHARIQSNIALQLEQLMTPFMERLKKQ